MNLYKTLFIRILLVGVLLVLITPLFFIVPTFSEDKRQEVSASVNDYDLELENNSGLPLVLKIPSLGVNSIIEYVGILPDGTMGVPQGPKEVAWFNLGQIPGQIGSAVISGHSGWKDGIPAVFDNLSKLKKGDKISIENDKGQTINFIVRGSQNFDPLSDSTKVFISNDNKSHLNLVTCSGFWDDVLKSHSKRLIIFTDKE